MNPLVAYTQGSSEQTFSVARSQLWPHGHTWLYRSLDLHPRAVLAERSNDPAGGK